MSCVAWGAAHLLGVLGLAALLASGAAPVWAQKRSGGAPQATPVITAKIQAVRDAPTSEFTGLIQPATKVLLSSEVAGRVQRLLKRPGDPVAKSEIVAELENPTLGDDLKVLKAHLRETEAQLRLAQSQQERNAQLFGKHLISDQQFQDGRLNLAVAEARLESDRAQVQRLEDQLQRMVIRSPIQGQVITSNLEMGQWITPTQTIYEIFNYDEYEVLVGVPGRLLPTVPESGAVSVEVPEVGAKLNGRVLAAVRHVDSNTGNFTLRVSVVNRGGLPLSGMVARVRLPLTAAGHMLTVPRDAVVRRGQQTHIVLVTEDSKAQLVPVQVKGNYGDDVIVIGKGLHEGQPVVVRGNERLFPGMPLRMAEAQPDPATGKL